MQPGNNDDMTDDNVSTPPPPPIEPPQPPQDFQPPEPVLPPPPPTHFQQPTPAPAPAPVAPRQPSYGAYTGGYFGTVKNLFTNPRDYFDNPPSSLLQSIIFPVVNLVVMLVVMMLTTLLSILTMHTFEGDTTSPFSRLTSDFWGQMFKSLGLSALYAVLFIAAIAGIIALFALIAKKTAAFKDILSMSSIFSLNFLAVSVASIIGLLSVWITGADFASIIVVVNSLVTSLVFVYATVLIIQGITEVTEFNLFVSTMILVASSILLIFVGGKIVKELPSDVNVSFGGYSNSISGLSQMESQLESQLNNVFQ